MIKYCIIQRYEKGRWKSPTYSTCGLSIVQSRPHHLRHQWLQISTFVSLNHIHHHTYFFPGAYCRNRQRKLTRCRSDSLAMKTGSLRATPISAANGTSLQPTHFQHQMLIRCGQYNSDSESQIRFRQLNSGSESKIHCRQYNFGSES